MRNDMLQLQEMLKHLASQSARVQIEKSFPNVIVKNEDDHFIFELLEDMSFSGAAANIWQMNEQRLITTSSVKNTLGYFSNMTAGQKGVCFATRFELNQQSHRVYWAIFPEDKCGILWQYQLLSDWYGGAALAYKRSMQGGAALNPYVIVYDPQSIFDYQITGDQGYMIYDCGEHYAIQAGCDHWGLPTPPPSGEDYGACCVPITVTDTVCQIVTATECAQLGGTYQGDGSSCVPFPC